MTELENIPASLDGGVEVEASSAAVAAMSVKMMAATPASLETLGDFDGHFRTRPKPSTATLFLARIELEHGHAAREFSRPL
jgi:hypothetical protein